MSQLVRLISVRLEALKRQMNNPVRIFRGSIPRLDLSVKPVALAKLSLFCRVKLALVGWSGESFSQAIGESRPLAGVRFSFPLGIYVYYNHGKRMVDKLGMLEDMNKTQEEWEAWQVVIKKWAKMMGLPSSHANLKKNKAFFNAVDAWGAELVKLRLYQLKRELITEDVAVSPLFTRRG